MNLTNRFITEKKRHLPFAGYGRYHEKAAVYAVYGELKQTY